MEVEQYRNGFTLIEVLIAITVFSIISISLFSAVGKSTQATWRAKNLTRAVCLAATQAEFLKALQIDSSFLAATDEPVIKSDGTYWVKTVIQDDIPISSVNNELMSKLITVSVFATKKATEKGFPITSVRLIKTRSI